MRVKLLAVAALLFASANSWGQSDPDPINAERPGVSSSPVALAPGFVQVESGYEYSRDRNGIDFEQHTLPQLLVRLGLADRVELQINWPGYSWAEVNGVTRDGRRDLSVGVKLQATGAAPIPLAVFAGLSLPAGSDGFSSDGVDPTVGLFWSYSTVLELFGTALVTRSDSDTLFTNAVGASFSIDDRLGAFVEYFGTYGSGGPQHGIDGGVTYLLRNDIQLDINAGAGLNDRTMDLFLSAGIAYRF